MFGRFGRTVTCDAQRGRQTLDQSMYCVGILARGKNGHMN